MNEYILFSQDYKGCFEIYFVNKRECLQLIEDNHFLFQEKIGEKLTVEQIFSNIVSSGNLFEKVTEDKHYVKPGSIFVSSEELFLCFDGVLIPVSSLECDQEGIFVRPSAYKEGKCPVCRLPLVRGMCVNLTCPLCALNDPFGFRFSTN